MTGLRYRRFWPFASFTLAILCLGGAPASALTIGELNPSRYRAVSLATGVQQYVDRTYTITSIPAVLMGAQLIRTANDDKTQSAATWITFTVDQPVHVYVAYDSRATSRPAWLSAATWTAVGLALGTSDASLTLYRRDFGTGTVTLGGNQASPGNGQSHYAVVVVPQGGAAPPPPSLPPPVAEGHILEWLDNASNESGYEIERSVDGGPFSRIATVPANTETHTATAPLICYRVRAVNAAGGSAYSDVTCVGN